MPQRTVVGLTGEWRLSWNASFDDRTLLAYQAPGVERIWTPSQVAPSERLAKLLGPARARVLTNLVVPVTTSDLAATLGVAPSTASVHLARLVAAGLADRTRVQPRVYYALSPPGEALVALLADASPSTISGLNGSPARES